MPLILDLNGNGLSGGQVYIGVAGQDPQLFTQQCWWDAAGTIPASQPLATVAGYFSNAGNVAQLYGPTNYSMRVLDSNGVLVWYQPTISNALAGPLALAANGLTVGTTQLVCAGGFVGMGTATPGSTADVAGTLRVTNPAVPTQFYALNVTAGTFVAVPSAGVTGIKWQSDGTFFWNGAGSVQYGTWNSAGLSVTGAVGDSAGDLRDIQQNAQASNYTLALADHGKHIRCTNTGGQVLTVPLNSAVAFPVGTCITIVNNGTNAVIIGPSGAVVMTQAGTGATGSRTLAVNGLCSVLKVATDSWMVTGSGLS